MNIPEKKQWPPYGSHLVHWTRRYMSYQTTRNYASEGVYLHGHHSNDFRSHKCSVATILHQDSPINQTLWQIVFTLIMKYTVSGSVPKIVW